MAKDVPDDTRGIVDPATMMRFVEFDRFEAGDALDGIVEWFWTVKWDLPEGMVRDQQVLNHPAGNISVGTLDDSGVPLDPAEGRVYGVQSGLSHRRLSVAGWTVAARTTVGGLGVLLGRPAIELADRQTGLTDGLPGIDGGATTAEVASATDNQERGRLLRGRLETLIEQRDPEQVAQARDVVAVARLAEHDRSICRTDQLAAAASVSVRSLQRLFDRHVGATPSFIIRRWRIIEAAEAARVAVERGGEWQGWATVAADLGYSDQAHLARDFRRYLGVTPSAYVARNSAGDAASDS